ncbi:MAG: hypothetical protein CL917_00200 [Deltaproteobacteria bacterium]|nr:hypothetical protein [Deltaproteobacteria bacterium]
MADQSQSGVRLALRLVFVFGLYFSLAAILIVPQVGDRFSTELIGIPGDPLEFFWNAWWIDQSLFSLSNPYFTDRLFAPHGSPLVWHSVVPLQSTLNAGLTKLFGPVPAYQLTVLLAFPLAGVGSWALCRFITRDNIASLIGGLVFMLSPFIASKTAGHLNLLYCGFLPIFYLNLLRAMEADNSPALRKSAWLLGFSSLAIVLSSLACVVFASNLSFFSFLWWWWKRMPLRETSRHFLQIFRPTLILSAPLMVIFIGYSIAYEGLPDRRSDYAANPEPLSYVLPVHSASAHQGYVEHLASPKLDNIDAVAYLGLLVAPLCLAGFLIGRREDKVRLAAGLFLIFLVFSLGSKLLWDRQVVEWGGFPVYLPFGIWRYVPILGSVGQSGRYLVISYMMMGIGMAALLGWSRRRFSPKAASLLVLACAGLVLFDFAISIPTTELPPPIPLANRPGRVVDLRQSPVGMYYQTTHGRPLVGGQFSRSPKSVLAIYDEVETYAWLRDASRPLPSRARMLADLQSDRVGDVCVWPGAPHDQVLRRYGFKPIHRDSHTAVWGVPLAEAALEPVLTEE